MAQFQVPQFIETEDKIIGPLTLKQFLYLAAAGGLVFISFFVLETFLWLVVTAIFGVIAASFAFLKYNGRPLSIIVLSVFKYIWNPKLYLWQRPEKKIEAPEIQKVKIVSPKKEKPRTPLKKLALRLATGSQVMKKKPAIMETKKEKFEFLKRLTGEREVARRVDYR